MMSVLASPRPPEAAPAVRSDGSRIAGCAPAATVWDACSYRTKAATASRGQRSVRRGSRHDASQLRRNTDRKPIHREAALDFTVAIVITIKLVKWGSTRRTLVGGLGFCGWGR